MRRALQTPRSGRFPHWRACALPGASTRLQDHIVCFDELEICGWYMNDREQFKKHSDNDAMINTSPNMGTIFDAYYHTGLGFRNELDIDYKRGRPLDDYPKKFELNELSMSM